MTIKNFTVGQTVFILNLHTGRNTEPTINESTVTKIGRKYVTLSNGSQYYENEHCNDALTESKDWGERTYLFNTQSAANDYIEKTKLELWLIKLSHTEIKNKYTLEQLRQVKTILD